MHSDPLASEGEPLFTYEQMRAWLTAQGFPGATGHTEYGAAIGEPNGALVRRVVIDMTPVDGWQLGAVVKIEYYQLNDEGHRYLLPQTEEDIAAKRAGRPARGVKKLRMAHGWRATVDA